MAPCRAGYPIPIYDVDRTHGILGKEQCVAFRSYVGLIERAAPAGLRQWRGLPLVAVPIELPDAARVF